VHARSWFRPVVFADGHESPQSIGVVARALVQAVAKADGCGCAVEGGWTGAVPVSARAARGAVEAAAVLARLRTLALDRRLALIQAGNALKIQGPQQRPAGGGGAPVRRSGAVLHV